MMEMTDDVLLVGENQWIWNQNARINADDEGNPGTKNSTRIVIHA